MRQQKNTFFTAQFYHISFVKNKQYLVFLVFNRREVFSLLFSLQRPVVQSSKTTENGTPLSGWSYINKLN